MELEFLGLSRAQWEFINGFANWLSAIGTIAAVWVSLWLARRAGRPSAKASVAIVWILDGFHRDQSFVCFRIVNTGDRPLRINTIGWEVGWPTRRRAIQNKGETPHNSTLPLELAHSEVGNWFIELDKEMNGEPWLDHFAQKMILPQAWVGLWTLRAVFTTSVGHTFKVKPDPGFLKQLRASIARQRAAAGQG